MSSLASLSFSFQQIIAILGLSQVVYALVYMFFRAGRLSRAWMVILYFFMLFLALLSDFTLGFFTAYKNDIFILASGFWLCLPVFSFLISTQIIQITEFPKTKQITVIFGLMTIIFGLNIYGYLDEGEYIGGALNLVAIITGAFTLLAIVIKIGRAENLWQSKRAGQQRYWLLICLILANSGLIALFIFEQFNLISQNELVVLRCVLAVVFTYLVSTSLFRIYPQATFLSEARATGNASAEMVEKLAQVFERDKLYQEQDFGRKELAQELGISEAVASELVNSIYKKSIPQLLKEYRIEDAKALLKQTRLSVQDVAQEFGFGSLTSFNRTFQEIEGCTPTKFRRN